MQVAGAGLGDARLADIQPPEVLQALQVLQPGIRDPGVVEVQPLEERHPFRQVFQAGVGHAGVEEVERGEVFRRCRFARPASPISVWWRYKVRRLGKALERTSGRHR